MAKAVFTTDNHALCFIRLLDTGVALGTIKPKGNERVLLVGIQKGVANNALVATQQAVSAVAVDHSYVMGGNSAGGQVLTDLPNVSTVIACTITDKPDHIRAFVAQLARSHVISDLEHRETLIDLRIHSATERFRSLHEQILTHGAGI